MAKMSYEKWKIYGNVFDNFTLRLLFKLSSQGHFEELKSPVSIGKEANVFTATKKDGSLIIVKIYRLESCNFNKMYDYIRSDQRFENIKKQRRKVIFTWVTREYQNFLKCRMLGVKVPTPLVVNNHILLMEMVGSEIPAPKLKDSNIEDPEDLYQKMLVILKKLFVGGLVHGDLSEYNILFQNNNPVLIDFSQGTTQNDPNFLEYWERDIRNMSKFLVKLGVNTSEDIIQKEIGMK